MKGLKSSEICEKIKSKLKNNEYEKVLEPKEKVHSISAFQVREEANGSTKSKKKVKDIWYKLQDTKGISNNIHGNIYKRTFHRKLKLPSPINFKGR